MKRSQINRAYLDACDCFRRHGWALPPEPRWDITDFGLGDFDRHGLTLVNLATEPEYCEKLMYARAGQRTPCHAHARKKEDIICRAGTLALWLWPEKPASEFEPAEGSVTVHINGAPARIAAGQPYFLPAGHRVTLTPGIWHAFAPQGVEAIIGEVSTANDDEHDNHFANPEIGRFPNIEENEPRQVRLIRE